MKKPPFELYRAEDGWRWRVLARNRKILADSGEAYRRKVDAQRGARLAAKIIAEHFGDEAAERDARGFDHGALGE